MSIFDLLIGNGQVVWKSLQHKKQGRHHFPGFTHLAKGAEGGLQHIQLPMKFLLYIH